MSLIRDFWTAMNGNEWAAVAGHFLTEDFIGIWPQTGEVFRGRDAFVAANASLAGQHGWLFEVMRVVTEGDRAASDVRVMQRDLKIIARAASFHDIRDGQICKQVEFWSYPNGIPEWRRGVLESDPDQARF